VKIFLMWKRCVAKMCVFKKRIICIYIYTHTHTHTHM
jgi:hypothetical protein